MHVRCMPTDELKHKGIVTGLCHGIYSGLKDPAGFIKLADPGRVQKGAASADRA